jgi:hypothetical protein
VNQSSSVFFSFSSRVDQSDDTSSAFVDVLPRAREASSPANTTKIQSAASGCDTLRNEMPSEHVKE